MSWAGTHGSHLLPPNATLGLPLGVDPPQPTHGGRGATAAAPPPALFAAGASSAYAPLSGGGLDGGGSSAAAYTPAYVAEPEDERLLPLYRAARAGACAAVGRRVGRARSRRVRRASAGVVGRGVVVPHVVYVHVVPVDDARRWIARRAGGADARARARVGESPPAHRA
jgi:hypothetical protein